MGSVRFGTIPTEIGSLTVLQEFYVVGRFFGIEWQGLRGVIPPEVGNLQKLRE